MHNSLTPIHRAVITRAVLTLFLGPSWLFSPTVLAQSPPTVTFPIVFPASTQTTLPGAQACTNIVPPQIVVSGPNGADTVFAGGQFIKNGGQTIYAISDSNPLCSTGGSFSFAATTGRPYSQLPIAVTVQVVNLGQVADVIYGAVVDDFFSEQLIPPQSVSAGGVATFSVRGAHINALGFGSFTHDNNYTFSSIFGIVAITVTQPESEDYTLSGEILDGSSAETKPVKANQALYAQVPLGLELRLGLKRRNQYVPAAYALAPAQLNGLAAKSLYPASALLEYARFVHDTQKTFRAVHFGTQQLTITPDDSSIPPVTVTLGVIDPGNLGNSDIDYDRAFVEWGNKRGIPLHVVKGLVRQEGPFKPMTYRYEPLNPDTGDLGISGSNLTSDPYNHYRMQTASGLSKGDQILDLSAGNTAYSSVDDVSPRNVFELPRGANRAMIQIRPIDECPQACVSAREILLNNDGDQNWTDYADFDINDPADLQRLDFTAQTPLAASYGLMQTMYQVAVELMWQTTDGRRNPSLLFDTPANLSVGGGTIPVGTLEFYKRYRQCRAGDWATAPDFADSDDYRSMIVDALNYYNHGAGTSNAGYGDSAWGYSQQFSPSHPLSKIFP